MSAADDERWAWRANAVIAVVIAVLAPLFIVYYRLRAWRRRHSTPKP